MHWYRNWRFSNSHSRDRGGHTVVSFSLPVVGWIQTLFLSNAAFARNDDIRDDNENNNTKAMTYARRNENISSAASGEQLIMPTCKITSTPSPEHPQGTTTTGSATTPTTRNSQLPMFYILYDKSTRNPKYAVEYLCRHNIQCEGAQKFAADSTASTASTRSTASTGSTASNINRRSASSPTLSGTSAAVPVDESEAAEEKKQKKKEEAEDDNDEVQDAQQKMSKNRVSSSSNNSEISHTSMASFWSWSFLFSQPNSQSNNTINSNTNINTTTITTTTTPTITNKSSNNTIDEKMEMIMEVEEKETENMKLLSTRKTKKAAKHNQVPFYSESSICKETWKAHPKDYTRSTYDRGHMVPAA
eukprot:CAMPEP_0175037786 /NCGR_PEP_ID=MMETSP0005-20121125/24558_1 /TAXON_ID=420556 /ORGANISM="Ochromonas sp., Strain CCMP1393" /LENGTH=359 /DNA_ID=CAMNT_0016299173 /DNA_START=169 /DNA_END=1245 /DNA_ORIENTATION=+